MKGFIASKTIIKWLTSIYVKWLVYFLSFVDIVLAFAYHKSGDSAEDVARIIHGVICFLFTIEVLLKVRFMEGHYKSWTMLPELIIVVVASISIIYDSTLIGILALRLLYIFNGRMLRVSNTDKIPTKNPVEELKKMSENPKSNAQVAAYLNSIISGSAYKPQLGLLKKEETQWVVRDNKAAPKKESSKSMTQSIAIDVKNLLKEVNLNDFQCHRQVFNNPEFNSFEYDDQQAGHGLHNLGLAACIEFNFFKKLEVNQVQMSNFLSAVEKYYFDNPFHNRKHALDVMQLVCFMLKHSMLHHTLTLLEKFAMFVAAACHDLRHEGYNNGFLIATSHDLCLRYNDRSVLENYHAYSTFRLMQKPERDILECVTESPLFRKIVIELILATDLANHFSLLGQFQSHKIAGLDFSSDTENGTSDDKLLIMKMALKMCDISHPLRKWEVHKQFASRVLEEFWEQGEEEKKLGMPLSPMSDRENTDIPKAQTGFFNVFVEPLAAELLDFLDISQQFSCFETNLRHNKSMWEDMSKSGKNGFSFFETSEKIVGSQSVPAIPESPRLGNVPEKKLAPMSNPARHPTMMFDRGNSFGSIKKEKPFFAPAPLIANHNEDISEIANIDGPQLSGKVILDPLQLSSPKEHSE
eukprot:TRINITY_DN761_c0_g1_i1.p1 TRINITY_DN761_c0_g1~~TRINITY_DN761_c0_g1_i1.p1  ORF type:complete len:639 (+),score=172.10 TRINITY_DN761_c0_g1_i1:350-2266(+)